MKSFDFYDVRLKKGMMLDALEETAEFYRVISFDSVFKYLREDTGFDAPGEYFTGWFTNSRGMGVMGQWISTYCRLFAITGEEQDRERAIAQMEEFWKLHDLLKDGEKPVFTHRTFYSLEKMMSALIDYKHYIGIDLTDRARELVEHAKTKLEKARVFGDNGTEWYTIGEAFYRAADEFDLPEALDVAREFEYRQFWDLFVYCKDPYSVRPQAGLYSDFCHAYSHLNSFNSCAMAYRKTKDPYYLSALTNFYDFMQDEQVMCTGGYGAQYEHIMPKDWIVQALRSGHDSFETQCDTYAVFRVVRQLTELLGSAKYSEWAERLIYNATLATIPMTPEGKVLYYSDYNMDDACKKNREDNWTCCTGTRPLVVLEMLRMMYFHDDEDLYVAQYAPSVLTWKRGDAVVTLEQDTGFPLSDESVLSLSMTNSAVFSLHLRKPEWIAGEMTVVINGKQVYLHADARGWVRLTRRWSDGDTVRVVMPQNLWMHALDKNKNAPNAFLHGPVVLAAAYDDGRKPIPPVFVRSFLERMKPVEGKPLHYEVNGAEYMHFKPFFEFKELEHYSLYFDTGVHATETIPIY